MLLVLMLWPRSITCTHSPLDITNDVTLPNCMGLEGGGEQWLLGEQQCFCYFLPSRAHVPKLQFVKKGTV